MIKILIVEDYPHNMRLIEQIINDISEDIDIVKAESGQEALDKASKNNCQLVLMDVALPDIDGIEVTKQLRNYAEYEKVPVIAVTAYAMLKDEQACRKVFDDYVTKPIDEEELTEAIKKWIGEFVI